MYHLVLITALLGQGTQLPDIGIIPRTEGNMIYANGTVWVGKTTKEISNLLVANSTTASPTVNDDVDLGYLVGNFWHETDENKYWLCLDNTNGAAVWKDITATGGSASISDEAYGPTWNGVTTIAPSKNSLYDLLSTYGTMATQNSNTVAITGGTINNTTIGATTRNTGAFTSLAVTNGIVSGTSLAGYEVRASETPGWIGIELPRSTVSLTNNAYYSSGYKYRGTGSMAASLDISSGKLLFRNSIAGTAGNPITFTNRFEVNTDGTITGMIIGTNIEGWLNNPAADDYVLTSTAAGVRTWVEYAPKADKAHEIEQDAKKGSVGTIAALQPVYISGYNGGGWLEIEASDASNSATMPSFGVTASSITTAVSGEVVTHGHLENIDTSTPGWSVGDELYVASGGGLTNTKPTGTNLVQKIAVVTKVNIAIGSIYIIGAGRSNDLPNLSENNLWIGDSNGVPAEKSYTTLKSDLNIAKAVGTINASGSDNVDWSANHFYVLTVDTNETLTFTDPVAAGESLRIVAIQSGGSNTLDIASGTETIYWPDIDGDGDGDMPTWQTTDGRRMVYTFLYDGSAYYATGYEYGLAP